MACNMQVTYAYVDSYYACNSCVFSEWCSKNSDHRPHHRQVVAHNRALRGNNCQFSHDVTRIQTTKLSILLRFYFRGVLEQLKNYFSNKFFASKGFQAFKSGLKTMLFKMAFLQMGICFIILHTIMYFLLFPIFLQCVRCNQ